MFSSHWPRGQRSGSAVTRLLWLRVRIPPGHGCQFLVSVLCFQVGISTLGWSPVRGSHTVCGAPMMVIVKPRKWRPPPGMWSKRHRKENKMKSGVDYKSWGFSLSNFLLVSFTSCPLDQNTVVPLFPTISNYDFSLTWKPKFHTTT
jgi:hypothetical protein